MTPRLIRGGHRRDGKSPCPEPHTAPWSAKAGDRTPLNRKTHLLRFIHLATVTGKSSTWESKWYPAVTELCLCARSYIRIPPLFHLRHSPFSHLVLVTSVGVGVGMQFLPLTERSQVRVPQMVFGVFNKEWGCWNRCCKGSFTTYGWPQEAGLQKFAKFLAGESFTPRGGSTQQTVILTSLPRRNPCVRACT